MDDNPLRFDLIDEQVRPDDQLTEAWVGRVGIGTPALAKFGQGVSGIADPLGKSGREGWESRATYSISTKSSAAGLVQTTL
jgi:hypothetical protein